MIVSQMSDYAGAGLFFVDHGQAGRARLHLRRGGWHLPHGYPGPRRLQRSSRQALKAAWAGVSVYSGSTIACIENELNLADLRVQVRLPHNSSLQR